MSSIFCIVGKSASGKDTIYKKILAEKNPKLVPVVPYTTRPKRRGEKDGVDYYFVTQEQMEAYEKNGEMIEKREYDTTQGIWVYFTRTFALEIGYDYILITTLEGAKSIIEKYGSDRVHVVCMTLDDKTRLLRGINREAKQKKPDYEEVCRRFIADQRDFSEENIGILQNLHYIDTSVSPKVCLERWNDLYNSIKEN